MALCFTYLVERGHYEQLDRIHDLLQEIQEGL